MKRSNLIKTSWNLQNKNLIQKPSLARVVLAVVYLMILDFFVLIVVEKTFLWSMIRIIVMITLMCVTTVDIGFKSPITSVLTKHNLPKLNLNNQNNEKNNLINMGNRNHVDPIANVQ